MSPVRIFICFLLLLMYGLPGAAGSAEVSFIPQWTPQAQFAGYYMALEKGFYKQHGLSVTILRGGPEMPPSELLEKGRATFGSMFLSTGILQRARGNLLVNVAQVVQRTSFMLVAKKSSLILKPADMNGCKIGVWGPEFQAQASMFFRRHGITVTTVPQSVTLNLFFMDGVSVASAMRYNEYHTILNSGYDPEDLTVFSFQDQDMDFPEDGIYCLEATYLADPRMCEKFAAASLEGWTYAFENTEETLDIVMNRVAAANVSTNRGHQHWMLDRMKDVILPQRAQTAPGSLSRAAFARGADMLKASGLIDRVPAFSEFFRGSSLP